MIVIRKINIKNFLNEDKFKKCETIQLNWLMHTDNNKIYYENKPLKIRFPHSSKSIKLTAVKSILKGKIPNIKIINRPKTYIIKKKLKNYKNII